MTDESKDFDFDFEHELLNEKPSPGSPKDQMDSENSGGENEPKSDQNLPVPVFGTEKTGNFKIPKLKPIFGPLSEKFYYKIPERYIKFNYGPWPKSFYDENLSKSKLSLYNVQVP